MKLKILPQKDFRTKNCKKKFAEPKILPKIRRAENSHQISGAENSVGEIQSMKIIRQKFSSQNFVSTQRNFPSQNFTKENSPKKNF